jgi:NAD(P)-dependent dehydrogenase (short-subunit alcohol dehydrogenase family)
MASRSKSGTSAAVRPAQTRDGQRGRGSETRPRAGSEAATRRTRGKLDGRVAIVTGGDGGIGRAVAVAFAQEGADVAVVCPDEDDAAVETRSRVEEHGRRCLLLRGDVGDAHFCRQVVSDSIRALGRLDVLVNSPGEQHLPESIEEIPQEQLERTFKTNVFAAFYLVAAALPHLEKGSAIINTTSVTAYRGGPTLLDYAAAKGAIVAFTRSLAGSLAEREIRVNAVAPGPVWTPLVVPTAPAARGSRFDSDVPAKRAGEPGEIAPSYVFLACEDSSSMTGQVLHPSGGESIN